MFLKCETLKKELFDLNLSSNFHSFILNNHAAKNIKYAFNKYFIADIKIK